MHRDVKLSDVMVTGRPGCPPGLGGPRGGGGRDGRPGSAMWSAAPEYTALETVRGGAYQPVSDVYGLGEAHVHHAHGAALRSPAGRRSARSSCGSWTTACASGRPAGHPGTVSPPWLDSLTARNARTGRRPGGGVRRAASVITEETAGAAADHGGQVRTRRGSGTARAQGRTTPRSRVLRGPARRTVAARLGHTVRLGPAVPSPLGLSGTIGQMVMSGMTADTATSGCARRSPSVLRGELQEAVRMLTAVVQVCSTALGRDHPTTWPASTGRRCAWPGSARAARRSPCSRRSASATRRGGARAVADIDIGLDGEQLRRPGGRPAVVLRWLRTDESLARQVVGRITTVRAVEPARPVRTGWPPSRGTWGRP